MLPCTLRPSPEAKRNVKMTFVSTVLKLVRPFLFFEVKRRRRQENSNSWQLLLNAIIDCQWSFLIWFWLNRCSTGLGIINGPITNSGHSVGNEKNHCCTRQPPVGLLSSIYRKKEWMWTTYTSRAKWCNMGDGANRIFITRCHPTLCKCTASIGLLIRQELPSGSLFPRLL